MSSRIHIRICNYKTRRSQRGTNTARIWPRTPEPDELPAGSTARVGRYRGFGPGRTVKR